jgi:ribosomal protein L32
VPQHKTTKARRHPKLIQEKIRLQKLKVCILEAGPFLFMHVKKQIK